MQMAKEIIRDAPTTQKNRQIKKRAQPKLRNNNNNKHRANICVE
jgi:hypothetical protein